MTSDWLSAFFTMNATVEEFMGVGGDGQDAYGAPVLVPGFFEAASQVKRTAGNEEVVGVGTWYCAPGYEPLFAPDSRVTVNGTAYRATQVDVATLDESFPQHMAVRLS